VADDDVTRDPAWEALHDRAEELARADVATDRDPQLLDGELVEFQFYYDEAYMAALCSKESPE